MMRQSCSTAVDFTNDERPCAPSFLSPELQTHVIDGPLHIPPWAHHKQRALAVGVFYRKQLREVYYRDQSLLISPKGEECNYKKSRESRFGW